MWLLIAIFVSLAHADEPENYGTITVSVFGATAASALRLSDWSADRSQRPLLYDDVPRPELEEVPLSGIYVSVPDQNVRCVTDAAGECTLRVNVGRDIWLEASNSLYGTTTLSGIGVAEGEKIECTIEVMYRSYLHCCFYLPITRKDRRKMRRRRRLYRRVSRPRAH